MGKDVSVNLDNIKFDVKTDLTSDSDLNVDSTSNLTVASTSDIRIDTSNIRTELLLPQPFRTESSFAITEPINSNSSIGLDIRPLVMDFCFKFEFGELPSTCIRQPYQHHFGITLFGVEMLGFNLTGETRVMIDEVQKRPQVMWGGEEMGPGRGENRHHPEDRGGVRVRLGP
jgi:hypothetical protein